MSAKGGLKTVVVGGLVAGFLDIMDAFLFWAWKADVPPMRIGQSIAGGLMGEAASRGGWGSFAIGMAAHFAIAVVMALVFYALVKLVPLIARHALAFGAVYGVGLYAVMTYVVVPMSMATIGQTPKFPPNVDIVFLNAMFCHVVLVGMVVAWFAKRAAKAG
jgi:hypothetical protein